MAQKFSRFELRTNDRDSARAFHADVLEGELSSSVALAPLPERAAAQGVPPHWLGLVGVDDVQSKAARIVALGGQPLGPI